MCTDPSGRCQATQGYRQACKNLGVEIAPEDCDELASPTTVPVWSTGSAEVTTAGPKTADPGDAGKCSEDAEYRSGVTKFCKELLFTVALDNVLCSQV